MDICKDDNFFRVKKEKQVTHQIYYLFYTY